MNRSAERERSIREKEKYEDVEERLKRRRVTARRRVRLGQLFVALALAVLSRDYVDLASDRGGGGNMTRVARPLTS